MRKHQAQPHGASGPPPHPGRAAAACGLRTGLQNATPCGHAPRRDRAANPARQGDAPQRQAPDRRSAHRRRRPPASGAGGPPPSVFEHAPKRSCSAFGLWTLEGESSRHPSVPTGSHISKNRVGQGWAKPETRFTATVPEHCLTRLGRIYPSGSMSSHTCLQQLALV